MVHRAGDGCGGAHDADLTDALRPGRPEFLYFTCDDLSEVQLARLAASIS
jgi:hypothetical protein